MLRGAVFLVGVVIAGCVPPLALGEGAQLSCSNNAACPTEAACALAQQRCVPARGSCVVGGDVVVDGTSCESSGVVTGVCHAGSCDESRCGDGVVALGEACDEGDDNSDDEADACRAADCTAPRCGDDVVDSFEACDGDVGLGGSCAECQRLTCRVDTASCDLDDATGCECAPLLVPDVLAFAEVTIADGRGVVISRTGPDQLALEHIDLATGAHTVVSRFAQPQPFESYSGLLVVDGVAFVVMNGALLRVEAGALAEVRAPVDVDDEILRVVADDARFYARTARQIVSFPGAGGDDVPLATVSATLDGLPGFSLALTRGGDLAFVERGKLKLVRADGTDAAPRVHPAAPTFDDSFQGAVAAVDDDVLVWGSIDVQPVVVRVTPTAAFELARLSSEDQPGPRIVVEGNTAMMCTLGVIASLTAIVAVDLEGGPVRALVASNGSCGFDVDAGRFFYGETGRLRLLTVAP